MARSAAIDNLSTGITLASPVSAGGSSATISSSPTYWPSSGTFSVFIEDSVGGNEVISCTRSTTTLTLSGTFAFAHSSGVSMTYVGAAADWNNKGNLDSTNTWASAQTFTSGAIANTVTSVDATGTISLGGGQAGLTAGADYFVMDSNNHSGDVSVPLFGLMFAPQFADQGAIAANYTVAAPDYQRQEFEPTVAGLVIELPDPLAGNTSHEFTNNATAYNLLMDMVGGATSTLRGGVYVIGPGETVEVTHDGGQWNPTKRRTRQIANHFADAGTPASTAETTLYTDSILGYTLYKNGDAFKAVYGGTYANNANTKRLRLKFDGTTVLDTAALTGNAAGHWSIEATFVRVSATVVRCTAQALVNGVTLTAPIVTYTAVTVANLTADRTLLLTGQNGTGTANDIVAKEAVIEFVPAA